MEKLLYDRENEPLYEIYRKNSCTQNDSYYYEVMKKTYYYIQKFYDILHKEKKGFSEEEIYVKENTIICLRRLIE